MDLDINDKINVIAFDADDTLWRELDNYELFEHTYCCILKQYYSEEQAMRMLQETEKRNIPFYGYGLKSVMLSMVETLCNANNNVVNPLCIKKIIEFGQTLMKQPVELLAGVEEVLQQLSGNYKLALATKGDLLDQQRKVEKSGLRHLFSHIEIMSYKNKDEYKQLCKKLDCSPENFLMVGNSLKSDILPVIELGGYAVHIPYHITWVEERYDEKFTHPRLFQLSDIKEVLTIL